MYFIGVTTGKSSIMKVFPLWAKELGLKDAVMKGIDIGIHAPAKDYIDAVAFIKNDPLSMGALVTTHKLDLLNATRGMFDTLDYYATALEEISSISKRGGRLIGHAKDPISSGLALEEFVPANYLKDNGGEVLLLGAGGSSLAMSMYFCQEKFKGNMPKKIIIANRSTPRLEAAKEKLAGLSKDVKFEFIHGPKPSDNDAIMASMPPHSLVVNATGLGKDAPGSPITDNGVFPADSLVWEINYRGELDFMHQAEKQRETRNIYIEDGWMYFIYGWTQVIAEVFDVKIEGEALRKCDEIAATIR
jgi:shikimate 5-dehydrogenase